MKPHIMYLIEKFKIFKIFSLIPDRQCINNKLKIFPNKYKQEMLI